MLHSWCVIFRSRTDFMHYCFKFNCSVNVTYVPYYAQIFFIIAKNSKLLRVSEVHETI